MLKSNSNKVQSAKSVNSVKQMKVLAFIFVLVALGGLFYWHNYRGSAPRALFSSADQASPKWPSTGEFPVNIHLIDHTNGLWRSALGQSVDRAINTWEETGLVNYSVVRGDGNFQCYPIWLMPESMNVCNFYDRDTMMGIALYYSNGQNQTILGGSVLLNDYYLIDESSEFATPEIRQKVLCWGIGFTLGTPNRHEPQEESKTCMNTEFDVDTVANMQYPDELDINWLKILYGDVKEPPTSSAVSYKVQEANKFLQAKDYGVKQKSSSKGLIEHYIKDLNDGYRLNTMIIRTPQK